MALSKRDNGDERPERKFGGRKGRNKRRKSMFLHS